jgi:hypothetical protein
MPHSGFNTPGNSLRSIKRLLCRIGIIYSLAFVPGNAISASAPTVEYQVKASLVFNFVHFVTWPADTFLNDDRRFTVCLVGTDVYGRALQSLAGEIVQGKVIVIKKFSGRSSGDWTNACQVAIFTGQNRNAIRKDLSAVADKNVLTIGENSEFLEDGGIIKFTIIEDTVRFEINLLSAEQAHLVISSKLLRLANRVLGMEYSAD